MRYAAAAMLATGAAAGEPRPFVSEEELAGLQRISLDLDSIELDGDEVLFSFDAEGEKIWARATVFRPEEEATLEERLKRALDEVKQEKRPTDVKRTSPNTIALFSTDEDFIKSRCLREV